MLDTSSSGGHVAGAAGSPARALILATISFALAFAAWGLVGGLASVFSRLYGLTASETAFLVAVPVLLGSLARLPMGMLTDRFGGRLVFTALLAFSALAAFVVPLTTSYGTLLVSAFLIGMAGSSFAVGAAFVSRWTPAAKQGAALGVYGLGTMGQSLAVFVGPLVAARFGWEMVFRGTGALLLAWAVAYFLLARNPPVAGRPATVAAMAAILRRAPTAWLLGGFYFLTFGGFVAFSVYLPTLLRAEFGLAPADAGLRAAGFVVLATLMRPVGGWLADRIGGAQVLSWVFGGVALFSLLLTWPSMVPFTVGALGCAMLMGLGNGAVFKLVPEHFPKDTGTVTGLVGALGGLGGFFRRCSSGSSAIDLASSGRGSCCCPRPRCCCARPTSASSAPATSRGRSRCRWRHARRSSASGLGVGGPRHGHAGGGHRCRIAQPAALRRRARRLHVRDALRRLRDQLSLRDVATAAAHAHVLASRVAGVLHTAGAGGQHAEPRPSRAGGVRRQRVHLPARPAPRTRALADHVGLPARRGDHVPARLGLDSLRDGPGQSPHVPHVRVRYRGAGFPRGVRRWPSSSSTGSSGRRSW